MNLVLVLATTLAVLALVLFAPSRRVRTRIGIPAGEIFYQDLGGQPFQAEISIRLSGVFLASPIV